MNLVFKGKLENPLLMFKPNFLNGKSGNRHPNNTNAIIGDTYRLRFVL